MLGRVKLPEVFRVLLGFVGRNRMVDVEQRFALPEKVEHLQVPDGAQREFRILESPADETLVESFHALVGVAANEHEASGKAEEHRQIARALGERIEEKGVA